MKNLLLNNYKIKILSVFLAAGLWWFVYSSQNPRVSTSFLVRINYINLAPDLKLETGTKSIRVDLKSYSRIIENVGPENIKAIVDLGNLREGSHKVGVRIDNKTGLRLRSGVSSVKVRLSLLNKIELPVNIGLRGSLRKGASLGKVSCTPMSVTVYGEQDVLRRVDRLVAQVYLAGRGKSFKKKVRLTAEDNSGNEVPDVNILPSTVLVDVPVQNENTKAVPVVIQFKDPSLKSSYPNADYYPRTVSLMGEKVVLDRIKSVGTEAFDLSLCSSGGSFQVALKPPPDAALNVAQVTLSCRPQEETSRVFSIGVRVINVCSGCSAHLQPDEIKVTVTGRPEVVGSLSEPDILAFVDLLGLKPGEHSVEPYVHLDKEYERVKLDYADGPIKAAIFRSGD